MVCCLCFTDDRERLKITFLPVCSMPNDNLKFSINQTSKLEVLDRRSYVLTSKQPARSLCGVSIDVAISKSKFQLLRLFLSNLSAFQN